MRARRDVVLTIVSAIMLVIAFLGLLTAWKLDAMLEEKDTEVGDANLHVGELLHAAAMDCHGRVIAGDELAELKLLIRERLADAAYTRVDGTDFGDEYIVVYAVCDNGDFRIVVHGTEVYAEKIRTGARWVAS